MAKRDSIFSDDWRDCLEAHYRDVVRRNDTLTEETLVGVLHSVGMTDDDLRQIKLEATMRAEDLDGDFVPDLNMHADHDHEPDTAPAAFAGVDVPASEESPPEHHMADEDAAPVEDEPEGDTPEDDTDDPDAPQQMSLF